MLLLEKVLDFSESMPVNMLIIWILFYFLRTNISSKKIRSSKSDNLMTKSDVECRLYFEKLSATPIFKTFHTLWRSPIVHSVWIIDPETFVRCRGTRWFIGKHNFMFPNASNSHGYSINHPFWRKWAKSSSYLTVLHSLNESDFRGIAGVSAK